MRAVPTREGVGRETRVDQRDGGGHERVLQVGEIRRELRGEQHALIDERAGREAGHIPRLGAKEALVAELGGGAFADDVELALESELGGQVGGTADEHLANVGLAGFGGFAERVVIGGNGAPAEEGLTLALNDLRELFLDLAAMGGVARKKGEPGAIQAGVGERDAGLFGGLDTERMRNLEQDSGAVTGVGLAAGGTAVVEVFEDLDALAEDFVGGAALQIGDETDATRIMLKPRIVEPLLGGTAETGRRLTRRRDGGGGSGIFHDGMQGQLIKRESRDGKRIGQTNALLASQITPI